MREEIRLAIPAEEGFRPVAHLVAGGLAARLELTYEELDDLQTALDALLGLRDDEGEVVLALTIAEDALHASVGPFSPGVLRDLDENGSELDLRRVLETVCDSWEVERREDGAWLDLTKRTRRVVVS
jgi:hypothetical protein